MTGDILFLERGILVIRDGDLETPWKIEVNILN